MPTNAQSALRAAVQYEAVRSGLINRTELADVLDIAERFQAWLNEQEGRGAGANRTETAEDGSVK